MATLIGIALWALIPGFIANKKGRNFWGYYFLSFLISPLITMIITLFLSKKTESDYLEEDPNRLVECKSCGYRDNRVFTACPKCGKYEKMYVYINQEPASETNKILFCRKCGAELVEGSKFCRKCGSDVIVEPAFLTVNQAEQPSRKAIQCDCGEMFYGVFCPVCGQKAKTQRNPIPQQKDTIKEDVQVAQRSHVCECGTRFYEDVCPNCGRENGDNWVQVVDG